MMHSRSLSLLLAFFLLCTNAQEVVELSTHRIINDVSLLAVAPISSPNACNKPSFLLRNSPTQCLALLSYSPSSLHNNSYSVTELGCPAPLVGATKLVCSGCVSEILGTVACPSSLRHFCFALNPTTNSLVLLNDTGAVFRVQALPLVSASHIALMSSFLPGLHFTNMLLVDSSDNSIWSVSWNSNGNIREPFVKTQPRVVGEIVGIEFFVDYSILVAIKGNTYLSYYELATEDELGPFGEYTSVQALGKDYLGDFHVYDADPLNPVIKVSERTAGTTIRIIDVEEPIKFLANTRHIGLGIDSLGIVTYEEDFSYTLSWVNKTCDSRVGTITASIKGGNFPYTILSEPDNVRKVINYNGDATLSITTGTFPKARRAVLVDEQEIHRNLAYIGSLPNNARWWAPASQYPPYSGSSSLAFTLIPASTFGIGCGFDITCMSASQFRYLEFAINIGNGGQHFLFSVLPSYEIEVKPGTWPTNTWIKFKFDIPAELIRQSASINGFQSIQFIDYSYQNNQNPIYLDGMVLIPHEFDFPARQIFIKDGCGKITEEIIPYHYEPFQIEVLSEPVSCNANSTIDSVLAADGQLTVNITNGGRGPFQYKWGIDSATTSILYNKSAFSSYITVYDNNLNSSWIDFSLSSNYTLQSSKYFRSPPYSIEFVPTSDRDGVVFHAFPEIAFAEFSTLEFWVNGGESGGQTVRAYLARSFDSLAISTNSIALNAGSFEILPNTWTKVTLNGLPEYVNDKSKKYNMIGFLSATPGSVIRNNVSLVQPPIYIDDIVLLGREPVVTVTDSTGCKVTSRQVRVSSPEALKQQVTVTNARCNNFADGSVVINVEGGTAPYHFEWADSTANDASLTGLGESIVYFNVTDSKSCTSKPSSATILQPPPLSIEVKVNAPQCYGGKGITSASAVGGSGVYSYSWHSWESSQPRVILQSSPVPLFIDSLSSGLQSINSVVVCQGTGSHLQLPYVPSHSGYCSLSLFNSFPSASIKGSVSNFNPQKYNKIVFWALSESTAALNAATISLSFGNDKSEQVLFNSINQAPLLPNTWVKFEVPFALGTNKPDGIVFNTTSSFDKVLIDDLVIIPIVASGHGVAVLNGFVSTVETDAGEYVITVTDGNGCFHDSSFTVFQPQQINIVAHATQNGNDGSISLQVKGSLQVTGGNAPYTFQWLEETGEERGEETTSPDVSDLEEGIYYVRVKDSSDCSRDFQVEVVL